MGRAKINSDVIRVMSLFESVTGARLKDCIMNEKAYFIVQPNQTGIAIGKNGSSIKKIEFLIKKKSIVVEYNSDKLQFARNLADISSQNIESVSESDGFIEIKCPDFQSKSILIGRNRHNIKFIEEIVKRHFDIKGINVI